MGPSPPRSRRPLPGCRLQKRKSIPINARIPLGRPRRRAPLARGPPRRAELLLLQEPHAALHAASADATTDHLLDGLLALADTHGTFWEALLDLRCHVAEVQAILRLCKMALLDFLVRTQRDAEKDIACLASSACTAARLSQVTNPSTTNSNYIVRTFPLQPTPTASSLFPYVVRICSVVADHGLRSTYTTPLDALFFS